MKLKEARQRYSHLMAEFLKLIADKGYIFALDDGKTTSGHMRGSLHYLGLAQDILLYNEEGEYLSEAKDYIEIGQLWKSLDPLCRWGGDFPEQDADHFSFAPPELVGNRA